MMTWEVVRTGELEATSFNQFWKCLSVWIAKPLIYRRDCGGVDFFPLGFHKSDDFYRFAQKSVRSLVQNPLESYLKLSAYLSESLKSQPCSWVGDEFFDDHNGKIDGQFGLIMRVVYPKSGAFSIDVIELIKCNFAANFVEFTKPALASDEGFSKGDYGISYDGKTLKFLLPSGAKEHDEEMFRISDVVFKKIPILASSNLLDKQVVSLRLVHSASYVETYNRLKSKYMKPILKIWTESTDPDKSIHQAIGIAAYLLCLWSGGAQRFVDLGCGNGLLVHILNGEGHRGIGFDVRSRKIWSKFPPTTILVERAFSPSDDNLFPDSDWIIGNHSDELTPWIPIIAARSSPETNFFLLPCCPYEFSGKKYQRRNTKKSQYMDYLDYVEEICRNCGFKIERDRLRIPSTKRTCFIGTDKNYDENTKNIYDNLVSSMLNGEKKESSKCWSENFTPRPPEEKVRNCTQLDKNLISEIVMDVANVLLNSNKDSLLNSNASWNEGVYTKLCDIINFLSDEQLGKLKKECGGLQTLLKNHRYIFLVEKGCVKFRKPVERQNKSVNWKKTPCWFYNHHPDSCPLESEKCSYIHMRIK